MKRIPFIIAIVTAIVGLFSACSKADPPCPPNARDVAQQEADDALARKAREETDNGNGNGPAATLNCGYDEQPDGTYRKVGEVKLTFDDVLHCVDEIMVKLPGATMSDCLIALARSAFPSRYLGVPDDMLLQVVSKVACVEFSRNVEVNADDHGLQRISPEKQLVPVIIYGVIDLINAAMTPVTGPAMFILKPGSGPGSGIEACVQPSDVAKRCTDADGCPEPDAGRPPGAEDPGTSGGTGDVIPPGQPPGGATGDYP